LFPPLKPGFAYFSKGVYNLLTPPITGLRSGPSYSFVKMLPHEVKFVNTFFQNPRKRTKKNTHNKVIHILLKTYYLKLLLCQFHGTTIATSPKENKARNQNSPPCGSSNPENIVLGVDTSKFHL
jgi:hypothetical protein